MSQQATFHLKNQVFRVVECEFFVSKPADYIGKPTGEPAKKTIDVRLEVAGDASVLQQWTASDTMHSGNIFVVYNEKLNRHRTLYFINARCMNYQQLPPEEQEGLPQVQLQLEAQELTMSSSGKYIDLWTRKEETRRLN